MHEPLKHGVSLGLLISAQERRSDYAVEARKGGLRTGVGLGLYMVKLVAEGHGGSVEVLDRVGGGALFRLVLHE